MSTSKSFQNQQGFSSYRPHSPKLNSNSPTSNNTNQNHSYVPSQARNKVNTNNQMDHLANIKHQNNMLREENKALKRQLNIMKGQFYVNQSISSSTAPTTATGNSNPVNDLRQTIKKQAGQIKQLKTRLQVVSKQCKMYEQIIGKMQGKINKLSQQNKVLQQKLKQCKMQEKNEKQEKGQQGNKYSKERMHQLTQKLNQLIKQYSQLQAQVNLSDKEWEMWKEQWGRQKSYYLHRIHDLEEMMGIGIETKQFYKKRY